MQKLICWAENTNRVEFVIASRLGVTTKEMGKA